MPTPVKPITITDFSPGLQTQADPSTLAPGAAQVCQNVILERTDLYVRDGRVINTACPAQLTTNIRAISELFMAGHSPEHRFIAVNATKIYWNVTQATATARANTTAYVQGKMLRPAAANGYIYEVTTAGTTGGSPPVYPTTAGTTVADGTAVLTCRDTDMWDEIDSTFTVHATNLISMQEFGGMLYIADGSDWVLQLTADGGFTRLTDFPGPTTAPTIVTNSADMILDLCDGSTAKKTTDPFYNYQGGAKVGGSWTAYDYTPGKWHTWQGNADNPDVGDVDEIYAFAQTGTLYAADDIDRTHSMQLFISAESGHTLHLDCGDVYLMRNLPPPPVSGKLPTREDAYDLSGATRVNFSMYVEADEMLNTAGGSCTFYLVLGEEAATSSAASNWQKVQITTDVNGTALASLAVETWLDFSVDITGLSDAAINAVRYLGFLFENLDLQPETAPAGTENDYIKITFSPITVNMSSASFMQDTYEITNTEWDDTLDEESPEYINPGNLAQPYPSIVINYNIPSSLTITATRAIGSAAEKAYVYARGGVEKGDLRKIGEITFTGDTTAVRTASMTWQGIYASDQPYLPHYIGRPPKGVAMMTQYRNRMLYAGRLPRLTWTASTAVLLNTDVVPITLNGFYYVCTTAGTTGATEPSWGTTPGGTTADNTVTWTCYTQDASDVLFYSNYGDPSRVKIIPFSLAQSPVTEGGWVDTERYGDNITGLIGAGMFLYALKRKAIFRGRGDPGITGDAPDSFFLEQLVTRDGCVSAKSVVNVEGRMCWQGKDKILSLGAGENTPISLTDEILPTVQAYSVANQEAAFAVYDGAAKRFFMFYPTGSDVAAPDSECLLLSLKGSAGWTQWTAQPGACGIYSTYAPTPGVYLADAYGTSGRGKLFRLSSTALTDAISYGSAAAISWAWVSGEIVPFPGAYMQVDGVRGSLVTADTSSDYTLAATLWLNNDDARTKTRNLTVTRKIGYGDESQGTGLVDWTLAPHGEVESFAIKLARNDANIVAIRNVTITARAVAPLRGRTVARG